jgi:hypothetical protein
MWNRRSFLTSCVAGVGMASGAVNVLNERILAAGRATAGLSPDQVSTNEDFWFEVQQAFTEDRNIVNLNNGTIQNGLRIVQCTAGTTSFRASRPRTRCSCSPMRSRAAGAG